MIHNYDQWDVYEGASEGSGRSDKIWLINNFNNEIGLFKFTKTDKTTEHISEKLASQLANLIGLESAKIEIGKYNSKIGSMSYLINNQNEILIEGIYLINKIYPDYNPESMYDNVKKKYYSIDMILNSLKEYNLQEDFLKITIFDFLIGNTDRHQNNWAVIRRDNTFRICPLYDNGSSLCCYLQEKSIDSYLGNDKVRFNSLVDSKSRSRIRIDSRKKKEPTHLEVIEYIKVNYYNSVIKLIKSINKNISNLSIEKIISMYSDDLISTKRKKLIKKFLLAKVELMNKVFRK